MSVTVAILIYAVAAALVWIGASGYFRTKGHDAESAGVQAMLVGFWWPIWVAALPVWCVGYVAWRLGVWFAEHP